MRRVYIAEVLDIKYLKTNLFSTNSILLDKCKYSITTLPRQTHKQRIVVESDSELSLIAMEQAISIIVHERKLTRIE
jgi:hypothetical protein